MRIPIVIVAIAQLASCRMTAADSGTSLSGRAGTVTDNGFVIAPAPSARVA
jgi:hypothetical protein